MILDKVTLNKHGAYFIYKVKVKRGIHNKKTNIADEVLIVGVNKERLDSFCKSKGIYITNLYVRDSNNDNIILVNDGSYTYIKELKE